jgi:hypothetical protein
MIKEYLGGLILLQLHQIRQELTAYFLGFLPDLLMGDQHFCNPSREYWQFCTFNLGKNSEQREPHSNPTKRLIVKIVDGEAGKIHGRRRRRPISAIQISGEKLRV